MVGILWNTSFLLGNSIFRGYVSSRVHRECNVLCLLAKHPHPHSEKRHWNNTPFIQDTPDPYPWETTSCRHGLKPLVVVSFQQAFGPVQQFAWKSAGLPPYANSIGKKALRFPCNFRTQNRHNTRACRHSQVVAATAVWSSLPRRLNFFGSGGRRKEVTWRGEDDDEDDDDDHDILDVTFLDEIRFSTVDAELLCKYPGCVVFKPDD